MKEYIRKAEYRCEHMQETADSIEESFLLSTTPLILRLEEGSFISKLSNSWDDKLTTSEFCERLSLSCYQKKDDKQLVFVNTTTTLNWL